MEGLRGLLILSLCAYAFAIPQPLLQARQNLSQCPRPWKEIASCMAATASGGGPTFYSAICSVFPPLATTASTVFSTSTSTRTVFSPTVTSFTTPPFVRRTTVTTTTTSTIVISTTTTVEDGVVTSGTRTAYTTIPTTITDFTCPNDAATGIPENLSPESPVITTVPRLRRQNDDLVEPPCLSALRQEYGPYGIRRACSCLAAAVSTSVVVSVTTKTARGIDTVFSTKTTSVRSTTTSTRFSTSTSTITEIDSRVSTIPATVPFVSTSTVYSTTRTTTAYPVPTTDFRIFFTVGTSKLYGNAVDAPGNQTGVDLIGFSSSLSSAGSWRLNNLQNLVLTPGARIAVNSRTPWGIPFVYVVDTIGNDYTSPSFSICNGTLAPGRGQSNFVFALCSVGNRQLLAYGLPDFWSGSTPGPASDAAAEAVNNGTCKVGSLGIEPVSGTLIPDPDERDGTGTDPDASPTVVPVPVETGAGGDEGGDATDDDGGDTADGDGGETTGDGGGDSTGGDGSDEGGDTAD